MPKSRHWQVLLLYVVGFALTSAPASAQTMRDRTRTMTVEDLHAVEQLGAVVPAPAGDRVAIVIKRPRAPGERYDRASTWSAVWDHDRDDIWVVSASGGLSRNLTEGRAVHGSYAQPTWAPGGRRLAYLGTRDGVHIGLYVWDTVRSRPRLLHEGPLDVDVSMVLDGQASGPVAWLDSERLVAVLLSPGDTLSTGFWASRVASAEWRRAETGRAVTASVLDTRKPAVSSAETMVIIHVSGRVDTIAVTLPFELSPAPSPYLSRFIIISPDRRHAAWLAQNGEVAIRAPGPLRPSAAMGRMRTGMVPLRRNASIRWLGAIEPAFGAPLPERRFTAQWSPSGNRLALVAYDSNRISPHSSPALFLIDPHTNAVRRVSPAGWSVSDFAWIDEKALLLRAAPQPELGSDSWQWWRLDSGRSEWDPVLRPPAMADGPSGLIALGPNRWVGLASGSLWQLDSTATRFQQVPTDSSVVLVDFDVSAMRTGDRPAQGTIVLGRAGRVARFYALGSRGTDVWLHDQPSPRNDARMVAYRRDPELALFSSGDVDDGPTLWARGEGADTFTELLSLNPQLRSIVRSKRQWIAYAGLGGDSLQGVVLLPNGYLPGRRYPTVTWVYAGEVYDSLLVVSPEAPLLNVTSGNPFTLELLAARGFAVLLPSMPLAPSGRGIASNPYLDMTAGVLPALDRIVQLGIADPNRLAIMGHSHGGYAVNAILSQTQRFRAAVAMASASDLVSWYGTFYPGRRYTAAAHQYLYTPVRFESGMFRMGGTPYADWARYLRNSPLYYAERIRTPLLLIHGDLDGVPLQQAEEMFTALHRLGRPARFIRYWGEGHTLESPANITHMWSKIFEWLEENLPE